LTTNPFQNPLKPTPTDNKNLRKYTQIPNEPTNDYTQNSKIITDPPFNSAKLTQIKPDHQVFHREIPNFTSGKAPIRSTLQQ